MARTKKRVLSALLLSVALANIAWAKQLSDPRECGPKQKCDSNAECRVHGDACFCNALAWASCTKANEE